MNPLLKVVLKNVLFPFVSVYLVLDLSLSVL